MDASGAQREHRGHSTSPRSRRADGRCIRLARWVLAPLVAWLLRGLAVTWRVDARGPDPFAVAGPPARLGATWHRNVLVAAGIYRGSGLHVAVSSSRDGQHIAAVMAHLGLGRPPRGSSSRGGVTALRGMVRVVDDGGLVGIFPDGPKGPQRVVKPGVIAVARLSGYPVIPVGISARPCLRFGSWDRMLLPLPFARVVCHYGDAIAIERDASPELREAARRALEASLNQLSDALDDELAPSTT